jgi:TRAP-type C4-dicarboxylate transport system permease small subunit
VHPTESRQRGRALRFAETWLGVLVAFLLFAMMLVTVVDVVGRYFFSQPLAGAYELTEIMLALSVFIGLPLICLREEHVALTLLIDRMPHRLRALHAGVVALIGAGILGIVAWQLIDHSRRLASYGDVTTFLRWPKAPIGYLMAVFAALAAVAFVFVAIDRFSQRPATPGSGQ